MGTTTATTTTTTTTASAPASDNTPGNSSNSDPVTGHTCATPSAAAHPRLPALDALHGPGTEAKVRNARVLAVGAGGVGCELLKNLASVGFGHVTVIDLDVVDFSNLNRQFLFRRRHVGKPKATEAAQSIRSMMPSTRTEINGVLHNIKDVRFDVDFFRSFTVVCNALDNLDARRHVNRMCLAADVALVDSGSTGYLGQCEVFGKGYECYDCIEHPPPKAYAVCTIRSTPEKPVHCVVWAKLLFDLVFGPPDPDNVLSDLDGNAAAAAGEQEQGKEGEGKGAEEQQQQQIGKEESGEKEKKADADENNVHDAQTNGTTTSAAAVEQSSAPAEKAAAEKPDSAGAAAGPKKRIRLQADDTAETFAQRLCQRVFMDDIEEQCRMESLWESRAPPIPQDVPKLSSTFTSSSLSPPSSSDQEQQQDDTSSSPPPLQPGPDYATVDALGQAAWTAEQSAWVLQQSLLHMATKRRSDIGDVKFDKDDRDALLFVTAASNLRASAYGVTPLQSPFSVKGIAGNIIHAVATTNAMVAGLIALEAVRITANDGDVSTCKKTLISKSVLGSRVCTILQTDPMRRPRRPSSSSSTNGGNGCFVCGRSSVRLQVDVDAATLGVFVDAVCRKRMGMTDPIVQASVADKHYTVYECGQGLDEEEVKEYSMKEKLSLRECRVTHAAIVTVEDLRQNVACTMHVVHVPGLRQELAPAERFVIDGDVAAQEEKEEEEETEKKKKVEEEVVHDVDDITWVEEVNKTRPDWGKLEAVAAKGAAATAVEKEKESKNVVEITDDVVVVVDATNTTTSDTDKNNKANTNASVTTNGGMSVEIVDVDADADVDMDTEGTGANTGAADVVNVDADVDVEQEETVALKKRRLSDGVNGQGENGGVEIVNLVDDDDDKNVKEPETKRARTDD